MVTCTRYRHYVNNPMRLASGRPGINSLVRDADLRPRTPSRYRRISWASSPGRDQSWAYELEGGIIIHAQHVIVLLARPHAESDQQLGRLRNACAEAMKPPKRMVTASTEIPIPSLPQFLKPIRSTIPGRRRPK